MRITNGAASVTGRAGKAALGIAVAGGAAVFVLAGSGIAMASTLPTNVASTPIGWNRVNNVPGNGSVPTSPTGWNRVNNGSGNGSTTGAGAGKGSTSTSSTGWNRVNNE